MTRGRNGENALNSVSYKNKNNTGVVWKENFTASAATRSKGRIWQICVRISRSVTSRGETGEKIVNQSVITANNRTQVDFYRNLTVTQNSERNINITRISFYLFQIHFLISNFFTINFTIILPSTPRLRTRPK